MRRDLSLSNDFRCRATVSSIDSSPSSASIMMAVATTGLVFDAMRKSVSFSIGAPRREVPEANGLVEDDLATLRRIEDGAPDVILLDGACEEIDGVAQQRRAICGRRRRLGRNVGGEGDEKGDENQAQLTHARIIGGGSYRLNASIG